MQSLLLHFSTLHHEKGDIFQFRGVTSTAYLSSHEFPVLNERKEMPNVGISCGCMPSAGSVGWVEAQSQTS